MFSYSDLIKQTFEFPNNEFSVKDNSLIFNDIDLKALIEKYGTPLKITYLPKITSQIQKAKAFFNDEIKKQNYGGKYIYSYCTKSSHFSFVLEEALKNDIEIETSSAFDIEILKKLHAKGSFSKERMILSNGFKREAYTDNIIEIINEGFNCIPILDNMNEFKTYKAALESGCNLGIRVASDEEPQFGFYTSRLGIRYKDIVKFYQKEISPSPFRLKVLHHFINTGIRDSSYYWTELTKFVDKYCELKKYCPELDSIDIGGGMPIKTSLIFEYDFEYMIEQIIEIIRTTCDKYGVEHPNIITEFGTYTVGESGAMIYKILDKKLQNDVEMWYMIDGSFITNLPDTWAINQRFILLAINNWSNNYRKANLGGLTCDSMDYYNSEMHSANINLPEFEEGEDQYIGFFHTGAYQESIGGYGGLQHCLIPNPQHIIIEKNETGTVIDRLYKKEQDSEVMLNILGY